MTLKSISARLTALSALSLALLVPASPAGAHARHSHPDGTYDHRHGEWRHHQGGQDHGSASAQALGLQWYDITDQTVTAAAFKEPISASRTWAVSWLAAAQAVGDRHDRAYGTAAFAQALHDALVAQVPGQQSQLDADLAATLATVPDGPSKSAGIAAGQQRAAAVLAARAGDGTDAASVDTPFTPPSTDPGVWEPTPPAFTPGTRASQGKATTFLLASADQFDPGAPPSLKSKTYRKDLAEIRAYGSATSSVRTPEQTDVALFWFPALNGSFGQVLRAVLVDTHHSLGWQTRFVASFHVVTTDAQIAVYHAKYKYVFWRPVTAIREDSVNPDPSWTPLSVTPTYPDWPSGHGGFVGAAQAVLTAFLGPNAPAPISLTSTNDPGVTRIYADWATITHEVIDARVWEGVHFRFSDEAGAKLGKKVGKYDLHRLGSLGI
jgi:hypothetical protein